MPHEDTTKSLLPQKQEVVAGETQTNLRNISVLCLGIFVVYAGFNTTQVFASKLLGKLGVASIATFYSVAIFTGGSLPQYLASRLGPQYTLFLSGMLYSVYIMTLVYCIVPLMFFFACLNGVACAVLWTVIPTEINKNTSDASRGFFNALLWASLKFSGVPGNLVALYVLKKEGSKEEESEFVWVRGWTADSWLFLAFACLCIAGSCMFLFLKSGKNGNASAVGVITRKDSDSQPSKQGGALKLLTQCARLKCLVPLMFFSGFNIGIIYGSLSGLMPVLVVPKAYIVIATVECAGSIFCGRISDYVGAKPVFCSSTLLQLVGLGFIGVVAISSTGGADFGAAALRSHLEQNAQWYVACALLGLADAGIQSQAYTVVGEAYTGASKVHAFAVFAVVQHIGLATAWLILSQSPPSTCSKFNLNMLLDAGFAILSIVGFIFSRAFKANTEGYSSRQDNQQQVD